MKTQLNEVQKLQKIAGIKSIKQLKLKEGKKFKSSSFEEKREYYKNEIDDIVVDMLETTDANNKDIFDLLEEILKELRNL